MRILLFLMVMACTSQAEWSMRKDSIALMESLAPTQQKQILLDRNHKNRWMMRYTGGGNRPGLTLSSLNPKQRTIADSLIRKVLSKRGIKMATAVARQDGLDMGRLVFVFFGDPRKDEQFGWRLGEHHFNIVQIEIKGGEVQSFGPILLGSNPYGPWNNAEQAFIDIYSECQGLIQPRKGKGIASEALPATHGTAFSDLPKAAQTSLQKAWGERMTLFTPVIRKDALSLLKRAGGWESLRLAFYGETPEKLGKDGGRWDAKLGNDRVLFDIETSRGHNHMSLWIKEK